MKIYIAREPKMLFHFTDDPRRGYLHVSDEREGEELRTEWQTAKASWDAVQKKMERMWMEVAL